MTKFIFDEEMMSDEQLLEFAKSYFNNEYIREATFDFENDCIHLTIVPPVTLDRINIECVLVDKENVEWEVEE